MKTWKRALKDGALAGTLGGLTSAAALALWSRLENGTPWGAVNAPSHWLWGQRALEQDGRSQRYTATGMLIHQLSAVFWSVLQERLLGREDGPKRPAALIRDATVTTAAAALVDLKVVPHRLSPGFQERLSKPSLTLVYSLFGVGLAVGSYLASRHGEGAR